MQVTDELTVEEMLSISINGNPYTMTMRTPGFEEELTRGILLSEDVYDGVANPDFSVLEANQLGFITRVNVGISPDQLGQGMATQRNLLSVSSCGMCGKYEADLRLQGEPLHPRTDIQPENILTMFATMARHQATFQQTGGCHAAALFTAEGDMLVCREDIGRHNAVDKAIGHLLLHHSLSSADCLLVSGRVSYEIVSKCYRARIPYLAAVSAPSSMAVDYCQQKGIRLFAFCRENKLTQYTR